MSLFKGKVKISGPFLEILAKQDLGQNRQIYSWAAKGRPRPKVPFLGGSVYLAPLFTDSRKNGQTCSKMLHIRSRYLAPLFTNSRKNGQTCSNMLHISRRYLAPLFMDSRKNGQYVQTLSILGVNMLPQFLQIAGKIDKHVHKCTILEVGVKILPHFLQTEGKMDKHILDTSKWAWQSQRHLGQQLGSHS